MSAAEKVLTVEGSRQRETTTRADVTRVVSTVSPWLNASEAAAYLRAPVSRVRKLTMTAELPCHRDGRRVLYHRDELDSYIRNGGATCP